MLLRSENIGLAGELLVCTEFVRRGFEAIVNPFPGSATDILVILPSKKVLRIQVKTVQQLTPYKKVRGRDRVFMRYHFRLRSLGRYSSAKVDYFALVALDVMGVLFVSMKDARRRGLGLTYSKNSFLKQVENSTENLLKRVK